MKVRPTNLDDLNGIRNVYKKDKRKLKKSLENYPLTELMFSPNYIFLVAEVDELIVGFIIVRLIGDEARIDFFSMLSKYRGKKTEELLLQEAELHTSLNWIKTFLPRTSAVMIRYFQRQGYKVENKVHDLYGKNKDGVLLTKDLRPLHRVLAGNMPEPPSIINNEVLEDNLKKLDIYSES